MMSKARKRAAGRRVRRVSMMGKARRREGYSITNNQSIKIPLFHFFEKVNKGQ